MEDLDVTPPTLPSAGESTVGSKDWPHAPPHRLASAGVYFVTARARQERHLLHSPKRRDWFQEAFQRCVLEFGWRLEAWAILSNHYHWIGQSPVREDTVQSLSLMVRKLHSLTTKELNRRDDMPGRTRLWHNYRETHLTLQRGYLARLHYVHENAAHHGLAKEGADWPWCSARAFNDTVTPAWRKTIHRFKFDQIARADGD